VLASSLLWRTAVYTKRDASVERPAFVAERQRTLMVMRGLAPASSWGEAAAVALARYEPALPGRHDHENLPSAFGFSLAAATRFQPEAVLRSTRMPTAGRVAPSWRADGATVPASLTLDPGLAARGRALRRTLWATAIEAKAIAGRCTVVVAAAEAAAR
jgi:hypothetical protein